MEPILSNYILFWICILGLCLGSFYNVVILRSLSDESIVFPPSKCPKCQNRLKPWHNIPVLSFIFLKGKCAYCKEKISFQYPLIELLTMVLFATCFLKFGLTAKCLFAIILCSALLITTATDIKEKLVDCRIAISLTIIAIIYNWLVNNSLLDSVYGLLIGIVIMEILAATGYLFKKGRAFGEADTYIAGALGACFGVSGILQVLFYTIFASMFFVIPTFIYTQYKNNRKSVCILFILFILAALIYKTAIQNIYSLISLVSLGTALAIIILRNLRKETDSLQLPLIPAFSLATLYFLFF